MEKDSNRKKITLVGLYRRMEMTKERISEFEDITINIPQSEGQRENRREEEKKSRSPGDLTLGSLKSQ